MSAGVNDGGPAFPVPAPYNGSDRGLNIRDYLAAKALPGLMARNWSHMEGRDEEIMQAWVSSSYAVADLMLLERAK